MKLKSILSLAAIGLAGTAMATVTAGTTLCRVQLDTSASDVLIALPLASVGATGDAVTATDFVLTTGLKDGDFMLAKKDGAWVAWTVSGGNWVSKTVTKDDLSYAAADEVALERGGAVRLVRSEPGESVYLYGKFVNAAKNQATVAGYTLVGNAKPAAIAIENIKFADGKGPAKGDKIATIASTGAGQKEYTWDGSQWTEATWTLDGNGALTKTTAKASKTFAAGEGFWYVSKAGGATIAW